MSEAPNDQTGPRRRTTNRRRIVLAATVLGYPDLRRGIRPARSPTRCAGACLAAIRSSGSSRALGHLRDGRPDHHARVPPRSRWPPVGGEALACLIERVWQAPLAHRAATRLCGVLARPSLRGRDHPPSGPPSVDPVPLGCPPSPPTMTSADRRPTTPLLQTAPRARRRTQPAPGGRRQ